MEIELKFAEDERLRKVNIALVELEGIDWGRAEEVVPEALRNEVLQCAHDAGAGAFGAFGAFGARIKAVRDMLRNGRYKPAGRAKPSSEYLFAAALDDSFPRLNPFVDAVNLASLKYMYPMSIFDADKAGHALLCRLGAPGEHYVFNSSGQEIDLEDLVCLCALAPAFAAESAAKERTPDAAGSTGAVGAAPRSGFAGGAALRRYCSRAPASLTHRNFAAGGAASRQADRKSRARFHGDKAL